MGVLIHFIFTGNFTFSDVFTESKAICPIVHQRRVLLLVFNLATNNSKVLQKHGF